MKPHRLLTIAVIGITVASCQSSTNTTSTRPSGPMCGQNEFVLTDTGKIKCKQLGAAG